MSELPVELPVWGWVLVGLGIIGAGIGLAYIIIFFFWKIAKTAFAPPVVVRQPEPEPEPEEEPVQDEPEPEPEPEAVTERNEFEAVDTEYFEEETPEIIEEPVMEPLPAVPLVAPNSEKTMVRFAMNLTGRFNHPFNNVRNIICWNVSLPNGAEVRDSEGTVMTLRITEPQTTGGQRQAVLVDETGERQIPLMLGKQYLKKETGLDLEKF